MAKSTEYITKVFKEYRVMIDDNDAENVCLSAAILTLAQMVNSIDYNLKKGRE